jgi:hypothetical protein
MARKKAYRRFEELTKKAMAPGTAEAEPDQASTNLRPGGEGTGTGPLPAGALAITLSPEVRRAVEQRAAADSTTPSEIVQAALRRYLEITGDDPQPVPAEKLVGKDELDEDDEMVLSADDLVEDPPKRDA